MKRLWIAVCLATLSVTACGGGGGGSSNPPDTGGPLPPPDTALLNTELSGRQTVEIMQLDGKAQLAATHQGLLWRADAESTWQTRSPLTEKVTALTVIDQGHYLVAFDGENGSAAQLYSTTDAGLTWQSIAHNFGADHATPITGLHYESSSDQVFAIGTDALAVSDRNAESWDLLNGQWDSFGTGLSLLRIDPVDEVIWYGGQGAIENGFLVRYETTTTESQRWDDLLPNPSTFKGGLVHPTDHSLLLFSGEGGIVRSDDNGSSWTRPLGDVDHRFYFDVVLSEAGALYTARYDKGAPTQELVVECSTDNGRTWKANDLSEETSYGGVKSLLLVETAGITELYLGLWENGIKSVALSDLQCD